MATRVVLWDRVEPCPIAPLMLTSAVLWEALQPWHMDLAISAKDHARAEHLPIAQLTLTSAVLSARAQPCPIAPHGSNIHSTTCKRALESWQSLRETSQGMHNFAVPLALI